MKPARPSLVARLLGRRLRAWALAACPTLALGCVAPDLSTEAPADPRETAYQRINAERKLWQQKGELSRITSEKLLEAAETYVDLLAARTSEAVLRRTQDYQREVLKWAEALAKAENAAEVQVEAIR